MLTLALALALLQDGPIASPEPGWPQWRGPRRDGVSDEKGLLPSWPEGGPPLAWKATGMGRGWSQPIVAGTPRRIFITGDAGDDLVISALDLDGKPVWQAKNGKAWTGSYPGARATAAVRDGKLYHMNAHGRAACFDAATGKELWAVDVLDRFGGQNLTWAISEGLLVDEGRVIVTPGGGKAFMAALDAKDGSTVWSGDPLPEPDVQRTGYASPLLVRWGGRRILVTLALRCMVGVDAENGKILWTHAKRTKYDASAAMAVYADGGIFYTLPTESGAAMLSLTPEGGVAKRWEHALDSCYGGQVAVGGRIYGSGYDRKQWFCLDAATGSEQGKWSGIPRGTLIAADDRLYCLSETGEVVLARLHPEAYQVEGRFKLVQGKRADLWTHPVVVDGRLYLRDHDALFCYDVRLK